MIPPRPRPSLRSLRTLVYPGSSTVVMGTLSGIHHVSVMQTMSACSLYDRGAISSNLEDRAPCIICIDDSREVPPNQPNTHKVIRADSGRLVSAPWFGSSHLTMLCYPYWNTVWHLSLPSMCFPKNPVVFQTAQEGWRDLEGTASKSPRQQIVTTILVQQTAMASNSLSSSL